MTVILGVVAGVAVGALIWSLIALRSNSNSLAESDACLSEARGREDELRQATEAARRELETERRRGSDAESRAEQADQRAGSAEARASSAEEALEALIAARSPAVIAEIERVRLEREWKEISGLDAPLPVRWDASPAAALEIELEIIREVTGTPSRLEIDSMSPDGNGAGDETPPAGGDNRADESADENADERADDTRPWLIGSLGCELVRLVARYADEMVVRLDLWSEPGPSLYVAAFGGGPRPDLSSVEMAAKALGMSVAIEQAADGFGVRLSAD